MASRACATKDTIRSMQNRQLGGYQNRARSCPHHACVLFRFFQHFDGKLLDSHREVRCKEALGHSLACEGVVRWSVNNGTNGGVDESTRVRRKLLGSLTHPLSLTWRMGEREEKAEWSSSWPVMVRSVLVFGPPSATAGFCYVCFPNVVGFFFFQKSS
jgi:hypothetical protein